MGDHAVRRASMMEARGQVAKRVDRYWLRPLSLRYETCGAKRLRASISKLPTAVPLQESDAGRGQSLTSTDLLH
jgi:hypothetical protein